MAAFTDYLERAILRHVFRNTAYTPPATVYVGLFTAAPTEIGGGTEVSGGAYARQAIAFTDPAAVSPAIENSAEVVFPTATASWGTVVAVTLHDALTAGNILAWTALSTSKAYGTGDIARIPIGDLDITLD